MEFGTQELEQVWECRPSPGRRRHEGQWKDSPRGIPKVPLEVGKSGVAPGCEVSPIGDV